MLSCIFFSSSKHAHCTTHCTHHAHRSRAVASEKRESLETLENKLEEVRDDSAKQVLAFREQAGVLGEETRRSEEAAISLRAQLRKTQALLSDAVRTIESLKEELQTDDVKRSSDYEHQHQNLRQLEQRLSNTNLTLKATEARYKIQQQEMKRMSDGKDRLFNDLNKTNDELETMRKQYEETKRSLLHMQRCARNAQVIENNAARFLRDTKGMTTTSGGGGGGGSKTARGKLNGNGGESNGGNGGLPEIGSPRVTEMTAARGKKKSKSTTKLGSRPGSAPLRRRDLNKV